MVMLQCQWCDGHKNFFVLESLFSSFFPFFGPISTIRASKTSNTIGESISSRRIFFHYFKKNLFSMLLLLLFQ